MIRIYLGGLPKYECILRAVRDTWNFARHLATLAQGSASEAHMDMDVNLCRLPEERTGLAKFLVPLAVLMRHPCSVNCTDIQSKKHIIFHNCRSILLIVFVVKTLYHETTVPG